MSNPISQLMQTGDYPQLVARLCTRLTDEQRSQFQQRAILSQLWDWLCWLKGAGRADSTIYAYASDVWEFAVWLQFEVNLSLAASQLTPAHLQDYQAHLGKRLSTASICRKLDAISGFFKYLVRAGVMSSNPLEAVPRSRPKNERDKWLPEHEAMKVLGTIESPVERAVFMVCYRAGLRRGELSLRLHQGTLAGSLFLRAVDELGRLSPPGDVHR